MSSLNLVVVTPTQVAAEVQVDSVIAPGKEGEFQVLPGHANMLAELQAGLVIFSDEKKGSRKLTIGPGIAEISSDTVSILTESAVEAS